MRAEKTACIYCGLLFGKDGDHGARFLGRDEHVPSKGLLRQKPDRFPDDEQAADRVRLQLEPASDGHCTAVR